MPSMRVQCKCGRLTGAVNGRAALLKARAAEVSAQLTAECATCAPKATPAAPAAKSEPKK